jgi:hypothetical protein
MNSVRKWLNYPTEQRRMLLEVSCHLLLVYAALHLLPFSFVYKLLLRRGGQPAGDHLADPKTMVLIVWSIEKAGRRLLGDRACLTKALVGHYLLSRNGYPVRLRIGAAKTRGGKLEAHAWIEYVDQVIIGGPESDLKHFIVLPEFEGMLH